MSQMSAKGGQGFNCPRGKCLQALKRWTDEACPPLIMTPQTAGNAPEEINAASLAYRAGNITTGLNFWRPAGRAKPRSSNVENRSHR